MLIDNSKYQKYFDEYNDYSTKYDLGKKYLELGEKVIENKYYQVLYYQNISPSSNRTFLIIPSIFNSPEILFLARDKSFIDNLREIGEVFLVDWLEVLEADYSLNDYIIRVVEIIRNLAQKNNRLLSKLASARGFEGDSEHRTRAYSSVREGSSTESTYKSPVEVELGKKSNKQVDLIGHCIGGNLAIASCLLVPDSVKSVTLLTTSWDFSHFSIIRKMYQYLGLDRHIQALPIIPKIHMQILFFLLLPTYFDSKLDKFLALTSDEEKDLFFRIEHWLLSGNSVPKATYNQIMDDMVLRNIAQNLQWQFDGKIIDPREINKPVYHIVAKNDHLAPKLSILPLHRLLKDSTILEVEGGHISYLINNKLNSLFKEYAK